MPYLKPKSDFAGFLYSRFSFSKMGMSIICQIFAGQNLLMTPVPGEEDIFKDQIAKEKALNLIFSPLSHLFLRISKNTSDDNANKALCPGIITPSLKIHIDKTV